MRHKSVNTPLRHKSVNTPSSQDGGRGTHVTHFVQLYPQPLYTASQVRTTCCSWDEGVLTDLCLTCTMHWPPPVLLYGSETWTIKARDARRMTAAEVKYMRRTPRYTWTDYRTNTLITKELKITPILDKLLEYKRNWIQHVNRMPRNRLPRVMKHCFPTGRMNYDRPLKSLWICETSSKWPSSMADR